LDLEFQLLAWKNPSRTHGYKWDLLKGKYKGSMFERKWSPPAEKKHFSLSGAFKTHTNPQRGETQENHPILNEWGGAQWSGPSLGNLHEPQTFPTSGLPHNS
jgi:hypothetical protein